MRKLTILLAGILIAATATAQEFAEKANNISYKKPAYIYLQNGDSIIGTLTKVEYRKGLIDEVKMRVNDKKQEIDIATIKTAYFPLSNVGKLNTMLIKGTNVNKIGKTGVNEALIKDGYVLYEQSAVMIKGKSENMLMQLINPAFGDKIRVYADMSAGESASFGVGGMTVAGGDDLSYYIKKGDAPAERIRKKDFKDKIHDLFGDCPSLEAELNKDYSWTQLPKYIYDHANCGG